MTTTSEAQLLVKLIYDGSVRICKRIGDHWLKRLTPTGENPVIIGQSATDIVEQLGHRCRLEVFTIVSELGLNLLVEVAVLCIGLSEKF